MISLDPTCPNQQAGGGSVSHNCDVLLAIAAALRERLSDKKGDKSNLKSFKENVQRWRKAFWVELRAVFMVARLLIMSVS